MEPTSDRIVEDIMAFPRGLNKIIENKGCVVEDEFLRSGRRYLRSDEKSMCKNKPRARQRISTLKSRPVHPDCVDAEKIINSTNQSNFKDVIEL
jgi:hypothetical protein